ncbi:hypothetical protein ACQY0O_001571 [Thecaphora frezii]
MRPTRPHLVPLAVVAFLALTALPAMAGVVRLSVLRHADNLERRSPRPQFFTDLARDATEYISATYEISHKVEKANGDNETPLERRKKMREEQKAIREQEEAIRNEEYRRAYPNLVEEEEAIRNEEYRRAHPNLFQ